MLRLIYVSFSAFLLLSTVDIQNAQGQVPRRLGLGVVSKTLQVGAAFVRAQQAAARGVSISMTSSVAQQITQFASNAGMAVYPGLQFIDVINWAVASNNQQLYASIANQDLHTALGRDLTQLEMELGQLAQAELGANNVGLGQGRNDYTFYTENTTPNLDVASAIIIQPLNGPRAGYMATQRANFMAVINAFVAALKTRAANFALPQMYTRANRLGAQLGNLVRKNQLQLLGIQAEQCLRQWGVEFQTAVDNLVTILLSVPDTTRTMVEATDHILQAMYRLFYDGTQRVGQQAVTGARWVGKLSQDIYRALVVRLNIIVNPPCDILSRQLAVVPI